MNSSKFLSLGIFLVSLFFCSVPSFKNSSSSIHRVITFICPLATGIQLAGLLIDQIPHMVEGHDHKDHKHEDNDHKDHKHKHSHASSLPFAVSGLVFLALLGVDVLLLHDDDHSHSHGHHNHGNGEHHHHHEDSVSGCNVSAITKANSAIKAMATVFAISAHSLFEGLMLVPEQLNLTRSIGIILHKLLESFSVGVAISASLLPFNSKIFITLFYALLTPLGILCAVYGVAKDSRCLPWFNSIAFGSLLYVVCVEMVAHQFGKTKHKGRDFYMTIIGFFSAWGIYEYTHND